MKDFTDWTLPGTFAEGLKEYPLPARARDDGADLWTKNEVPVVQLAAQFAA